MDPFTVALIIGGALHIIGGISKGYAARQAAYENAAILEGNAQLSDYAAGDATARGSQAEGRVRLEAGQKMAHQRAQFASSGVDVQSGSAIDVLSSTAMMSELDAQIVKNNAMREAWGYREQAKQFRRRADMARSGGDADLSGSILGSAGGAATYGAQLLKVK